MSLELLSHIKQGLIPISQRIEVLQRKRAQLGDQLQEIDTELNKLEERRKILVKAQETIQKAVDESQELIDNV